MDDNNTPSEADIVELNKQYQEKFGLNTPDLIIGMTPKGVTEAFVEIMRRDSVIGPDTKVRGILVDIDFNGEGETLPVGVYFENNETNKSLN